MFSLACKDEKAIYNIIEIQKFAMIVFGIHILYNYLYLSGHGYTLREKYHLNINDTIYMFGFLYAFLVSEILVGKKIKSINVFICLLIIFSTVISGSRSSMIVLGFLSIYIILNIRQRIDRKFIFLIIVGIILTIAITINYANIYQRFFGVLELSDEAQIKGRFTIYLAFFEMAKEFWINGTGLGLYSLIMEFSNIPYQLWGGLLRSPHSLYLRFLIEGGIILLIGFLVFLNMMRLKTKEFKFLNFKNRDLFALKIASNGYILSASINALVSESIFRWYFWCNLGLILSIKRLILKEYNKNSKLIVPSKV